MRTTLDIDEKVLKQVIQATGERTASKAVSKILESYLYQRAVDRLEQMAGKIEIDDIWRELEELELAEAREQLGKPRHK